MTNDQIKEVKMAWARGEVVQYKNEGGLWSDWGYDNELVLVLPSTEWRVRPRTIMINGHEVPKPLHTITDGQSYFYPALGIGILNDHYSQGCAVTLQRLRDGILHSSIENAELHAKALLSFTDGSRHG